MAEYFWGDNWSLQFILSHIALRKLLAVGIGRSTSRNESTPQVTLNSIVWVRCCGSLWGDGAWLCQIPSKYCVLLRCPSRRLQFNELRNHTRKVLQLRAMLKGESIQNINCDEDDDKLQNIRCMEKWWDGTFSGTLDPSFHNQNDLRVLPDCKASDINRAPIKELNIIHEGGVLLHLEGCLASEWWRTQSCWWSHQYSLFERLLIVVHWQAKAKVRFLKEFASGSE